MINVYKWRTCDVYFKSLHIIEIPQQVCDMNDTLINLQLLAEITSGSVVECLNLGFEFCWKHCVISLGKALYPLFSACSTQEMS